MGRIVPAAAATALAAGLLVATTPTYAAQSAGAPAAPPTCNGKVATIVGTPGDDKIRGTAGPDVIVGLGGNDTILGLGGNDTICGNQGADLLQGGPGSDLIDVGPPTRKAIPNLVLFNKATQGVHVNLAKRVAVGEGRDKIVGRGPVAVVGSRHADVIRGSSKGEVLMGFGGDDRIFGGGGDDLIDSRFNWARKQGYKGYKPAPHGKSRMVGGPGADSLTGGPRSILRGGQGNDVFSGGREIHGGPGGDYFELDYIGNPARDPKVVAGGAGRDHLFWMVKRGLGPMKTDLRSGRTTFARSGISYRIANVEVIESWKSRAHWTVWGTDKSETFDGSGPMTVHAGGGDDSVWSRSFDDWIDGGPGDDVVDSRSGDDTCINVEEVLSGCSN